MTTVTVDFRGTKEKKLKEMIDMGIVKTKAEALPITAQQRVVASGVALVAALGMGAGVRFGEGAGKPHVDARRAGIFGALIIYK